ncbi:NDP-hexose 2,3-dehydratase family protein [Dactylosporangium sp. NPDC048998]|uniref:NDP-hexose 2,3-dehydratase family protein n=1 Tax=Dactylosporangium sp. NPDC048998 TaxID=3363976 RepID=UPI0037191268
MTDVAHDERTTDGALMSTADFFAWFAERAKANRQDVARIPLADLTGWHFQPDTGNLVHDSGRFFSVDGLRVHTDHGSDRRWCQPIIVQPEVGLLAILVKEFGGVPHYLMQAKVEPGNVNGLQLSPTVQATRSNYTRVHGGSRIKYLEHFVEPRRGRVLVDVLQSEQGAWFLHKRNRNMIVEVTEDVPVDDDFCWLTLGQIRELLRLDHTVNMDARTVLSCIPPSLWRPDTDGVRLTADGTFTQAVRRSLATDDALHSTREVLSWLTEVRARTELVQQRVPLHEIDSDGWRRTPERIFRDDGRFFEVIGVDVRATMREVVSWQQPLVAPVGPGLLALLAKRIDGVLHALVQARIDAGALNVAELAPTVHCRPGNYANHAEDQRPPFLAYVEAVGPERIRYEAQHSEEGGRFYHAQNRYLVVEVGDDFPIEAPPGYRWLSLHQLCDLLLHSNYLNVELRTLMACIQAL